MAPKRRLEATKEVETYAKCPSRTPKPTYKKREGDGTQPIQPIQPPIEVPEHTPEPLTELLTQPEERSQRASPWPILQASQASQPANEPAWESQLVAKKPPIATVQTRAFSSAATEASVEEDAAPPINFTDFNGVDWSRLKGFAPPLTTPRGAPSWVYRHGWRIWKEHTKPEKFYFLCRYCHINRKTGGLHQVTVATSAAILHLASDQRGHRLSKDGSIRKPGQQSLQMALDRGLILSQDAYRELGNFDIQGFWQAAVLWLVNNNRPLREFETESFRAMIRFANPEAEIALW
ncbi:hypothetical protein EJ04DRAFT_453214, partial [Polyplosphaeria fusca]